MLTRQYAGRLAEDVAQMQSSVLCTLARVIADVLFVAGAMHSWQAISQKYTDRLQMLVTMILNLRATIGGVVAADMEVGLVTGRSKFDPSIMEDGNGRPGETFDPARKVEVLCTMELGLARWEKVLGQQGSGSWSKVVLLKPKIALESLLAELAAENGSQLTAGQMRRR